VSVTGLGVGFGDGFALGDYVQHSYHWRDVLTHIHGAHTFKVGYEGWHGDDIALFAGAYGQPSINYTNMIDLINNAPYSESGLAYDPVTEMRTMDSRRRPAVASLRTHGRLRRS
jgi:menaquinone-dependent protoporphyrinogen IX oxidase